MVWVRDLSSEEVQEQSSNFRKWMDEGIVPSNAIEYMDMD
jgi:hypothetical protein